jgi:hypothetical protein
MEKEKKLKKKKNRKGLTSPQSCTDPGISPAHDRNQPKPPYRFGRLQPQVNKQLRGCEDDARSTADPSTPRMKAADLRWL